METRRVHVLPTDSELHELRERVADEADKWYEAIHALRSHVTDAQVAKALSWPLAMVFLSNEDFERRARLQFAEGDRTWLAVVTYALIASGGARGKDMYAGEYRALQVLGDQVVLAAWGRHEPVTVERSIHDLDAWSYDVLFGIAMDYPGETWSLILRMMTNAATDAAARRLCFSWLETLWHQHGDGIIGWLETEAANSPRFRYVLRGCLLPADRPDLAKRIQVAAAERTAS
jgi:hypothetical protein